MKTGFQKLETSFQKLETSHEVLGISNWKHVRIVKKEYVVDQYVLAIVRQFSFDNNHFKIFIPQDGKRQIDYVLAYKPYGGKPDNEWTAGEIEDLKSQNFGTNQIMNPIGF